MLLLAAAVGATAQTSRVTALQNARNLVVKTADGKTDYHLVTTDKSLMFHKKGTQLTLNDSTMDISQIKTMRLEIPVKFALNEDSTVFTPTAVNHGLLALRYTFRPGQWHSLVLPCTLTGEQVTEAFGQGTQLACYSGITENDAAQIDFELVDLNTADAVVETGKCYIIRPTREPDIAAGSTTSVNYGSAKVEGPAYIIPNVTMEKGKNYVSGQSLRSAEDNVRMRVSGTYAVQTVSPAGRAFYYLNDEGRFMEADSVVEMKAFRNWIIYSKNTNGLPMRYYINGIGEDLTASIGAPRQYQETSGQTVYDLQGRRLNGTPRTGLYIINGKKVIIR